MLAKQPDTTMFRTVHLTSGVISTVKVVCRHHVAEPNISLFTYTASHAELGASKPAINSRAAIEQLFSDADLRVAYTETPR